ncbi:MAG: hypothetical protein GEV06_19765 [Luteitalea sp.]|nr:hypothetical protein [Luteitalea sp.]
MARKYIDDINDEPPVPYLDRPTMTPQPGPNPNATGRAGEINRANPTADPSKPYVQSGSGGYIDGIGETIREGSSLTQSQSDAARAAARAAGISDADAEDFLARNPGDAHRLVSALAGGQSGGGSNDLQSAYSGYLGGNTSGGGTSQPQNDPLRELVIQQLMEIIAQGNRTSSLSDPALAPAVQANRVALQRSADQQRAEAAERRAYDDSGGFGAKAFRGDVAGIAQRQGEAQGAYEGGLLLQQLESDRDRLMQGLNLAIGIGDADSARALQLQLANLQAEIERERLGFNYTALQYQANRDSTLPFF